MVSIAAYHRLGERAPAEGDPPVHAGDGRRGLPSGKRGCTTESERKHEQANELRTHTKTPSELTADRSTMRDRPSADNGRTAGRTRPYWFRAAVRNRPPSTTN